MKHKLIASEQLFRIMASHMSFVVFLAFLGFVNLAATQPFTFARPQFEAGLQEAQQRNQTNYTGFVFNFNTASAGDDSTPNGNLKANQVASNPFLSTLPGDGNGQTLVTLGPCAGNTPHIHPRGSEISFVLYGSVEVGFIEENGGHNQPVLRNITQNETWHVPQGLLHFSRNPYCEPAAFLANFATKDPGTQTMWAAMMQVPNTFLNAATGIPEATLKQLKSDYPMVTSPGTGGEECLKRCGLNFVQANKLTPLATN